MFPKRNRRQVVVYRSYHFGRNSKARQPGKRDFAVRVVIFIVKITVCSRDKRAGPAGCRDSLERGEISLTGIEIFY